ncbi:30S ribosomal protein S8 [Candidatus Woesebacteria bacterium CG22_combo_CG10-13_8_21_14_all_39_10]|uniref:Small ribosomal subunit protein uS8 n=4 Tax=Candidatus Woeseibacteriota TaxID=1752722 RepID=A0A2M7XA61_9BACT|nr:MAG: 30S ribosomal protein S8 [Candidatus Woesebacteria bacterium CG22_combo_CG10-13_8_21_14_all_39_10]PIU71908.1 MAG: 30S ribosomal protein S8 [Candidatus Woesebacteria bacterium CG06_land_8_20_14_3_00_39_27]PIZ48186.1 MAG: 30S ribosomal protein S8 [Candidatus Woesebacteria bacterium CG_4_10_14_0_2_um_filter_39_14]PJA43035.1 MAG: 30S ribosomal protein S8 [Candidatus Woesebacteria bacterium CG_4_9_14_3_um_filter_39_10]
MSETNYPVGDFLIRIKNAAQAKNREVKDSATKKKVAIAKALEAAGFIEEVKSKGGVLSLSLTFSHKSPVLMDIKLVSKPGKRVYFKLSNIEAKRGPSIYLISTPRGILTTKEVKKVGLGGEIIAEIW